MTEVKYPSTTWLKCNLWWHKCRNENSSKRSFLSSACAHNHLPFPKHLSDATSNLLGITFSARYGQVHPLSDTSSPWLTWINGSTANWEFLVFSDSTALIKQQCRLTLEPPWDATGTQISDLHVLKFYWVIALTPSRYSYHQAPIYSCEPL